MEPNDFIVLMLLAFGLSGVITGLLCYFFFREMKLTTGGAVAEKPQIKDMSPLKDIDLEDEREQKTKKRFYEPTDADKKINIITGQGITQITRGDSNKESFNSRSILEKKVKSDLKEAEGLINREKSQRIDTFFPEFVLKNAEEAYKNDKFEIAEKLADLSKKMITDKESAYKLRRLSEIIDSDKSLP